MMKAAFAADPIRQSRHGAATVWLLVGLSSVVIAAGGGYLALRGGPSLSGIEQAVWHEVTRGDFELVITERGEIESADDVEIRSEVKSGNHLGTAILRIVPEGSEVKKGDFLIQLDSSLLDEDVVLQQIAVNTAEALVVEAKNQYETAVIAKQEYLEGTFVQERETLESELFVAEENQSRAEEYLEYSKKLAAKGYVNDLQLEADRFAVEKAKKEYAAAKTKLRVLEEFTRVKMLKQCESDILIAKAKWESEQSSLRLENDKLAEIQDQIAKCSITAPIDGVVKYAHTNDRRGDDDFIVEEGATVRERQVLIRMPKADSMRVEMKINESLVKHVKPGMRAEIRPIGSRGVPLVGAVDYVNQYAEPSGWRKANVKEYKAYVTVESSTSELRSGMTASVAIQSKFLPDALLVPVQSVYNDAGRSFCFTREADRIVPRQIECGPTNDSFYVIETGLQPSVLVAVNPRALLSYVQLPKRPDAPASEQGGGGAESVSEPPPGGDATLAEQRPKKATKAGS